MPTELIDSYGRVHTDLRLSITDRCDLRCTYCMPEDGLDWLPRSEILSFEEIERLVSMMVAKFGIRSVRLTGGEPTVRHGLVELVERLAQIEPASGPPIDLSMTTNAMSLERLAEPFRAAGLHRVNVSLDTLNAERFLQLTRRDGLDRVLRGIAAAVEVGFDPVKINCVVIRGVNDDEVADLAAFARSVGAEMRFIEFMPLDAEQGWDLASVATANEIVTAVTKRFAATALPQTSAPAHRYSFDDGLGFFGVIASVTEPFCGSCDRIRITSEGELRSCLFALDQHSLRDMLRSGSTDAQIAEATQALVAQKWAGHHIGNVQFIRPSKSMSQIGG